MNIAMRARSIADRLKPARHRPAPMALILLYHRITALSCDPWALCVSPENFREHLRYLRANADITTLAELPNLLTGRRSSAPLVAITFDDGYSDNLRAALPALQAHRIPATFFLTVPWLTEPREFWWDELERVFLQPSELPPVLEVADAPEIPPWRMEDAAQYSSTEAEAHRRWRAWEPPPTRRHRIYLAVREQLYRMAPKRRQRVLDAIVEWAAASRAPRPTHARMSREEIVELSRAPLVEIGAHSISHSPLPALALSLKAREIEVSKSALGDLVGRPVLSFAYPHGDYCPATVRSVKEAGFARACTTRHGLVRRRHELLELPRFPIGNWDLRHFRTQFEAWTSRAG